MLLNLLKTTGAVAAMAIGLAMSTSVSAATYETRCFGDDCYRMRCNDWGYNCRRMDYLGAVGYVRPRDRLVCDADVDDCRWMPARVHPYRYDYDYDDYYGD